MRVALALLGLAACSGDGVSSASVDVVGHLDGIGCAPDIFVGDDRLWVGYAEYDISDPAEPVATGSTLDLVPLAAFSRIIAAEPDEVWARLGDDGATIGRFDVSAPGAGVLVTSFDLGVMLGTAVVDSVRMVVTPSTLSVLVVPRFDPPALAVIARDDLPDDGSVALSGWVDLPPQVTVPRLLAARGDVVVTMGTPTAVATDVSDPTSPVIVDELRVRWGDGQFNSNGDSPIWGGLDGAGHAVVGDAKQLVTIPVSDAGIFGEPVSVKAGDFDAPFDTPTRALAGGVLLTDAGHLFRIDGDDVSLLGIHDDWSDACALTGDGARFYVVTPTDGLDVAEVP